MIKPSFFGDAVERSGVGFFWDTNVRGSRKQKANIKSNDKRKQKQQLVASHHSAFYVAGNNNKG